MHLLWLVAWRQVVHRIMQGHLLLFQQGSVSLGVAYVAREQVTPVSCLGFTSRKNTDRGLEIGPHSPH